MSELQSSTSHKPHCSFRMLFGQQAGHGPVQTDENNAVIIPWANAGDNTCNLLQLSGVGCGEIIRERLSDV